MKYIRLFEDLENIAIVKTIKKHIHDELDDDLKLLSWDIDNFQIDKDKLTFRVGIAEPYTDGYEIVYIAVDSQRLAERVQDVIEDINSEDDVIDLEIKYKRIDDSQNSSHIFNVTVFLDEEVIRPIRSGLWDAKIK